MERLVRTLAWGQTRSPHPQFRRRSRMSKCHPQAHVHTHTYAHTKGYQLFGSRERVDLVCTSIFSLCLLLSKLLDTSCVPAGLLEDLGSSHFLFLFLSSFFTKILFFNHPCLFQLKRFLIFFFFLSLKLLARQMLAHSRGRQRKVFHPLSWTTAECCDSCFGILNRSQSSVSHLGPAVFPQWSSVLVFSCWGSSPTKKQGELFKLWDNYIVVCVHYTVFLSIVIYEDLSTTKIIFMTSP